MGQVRNGDDISQSKLNMSWIEVDLLMGLSIIMFNPRDFFFHLIKISKSVVLLLETV